MSTENADTPDCTQSGWYWYCDVHDTHGNADVEDEARAVADAHEAWWNEHGDGEEECEISIHDVAVMNARVAAYNDGDPHWRSIGEPERN